eukprot:Gb_41485 [translate_table: standard]
MRYEDVTLEKVRLLILAMVGGCLLIKRVVKLGIVDHRIGARCPLYNKEAGVSLFHVFIKFPSLVHIQSRIEGLESLVSRLRLTSAVNDDKSRLALLLSGEIGGRLLPRDWEVQGDGLQLGLAKGTSRSATIFEPTLKRMRHTRCVSSHPEWAYLNLWRIPRVIRTKIESPRLMHILQAKLEHGKQENKNVLGVEEVILGACIYYRNAQKNDDKEMPSIGVYPKNQNPFSLVVDGCDDNGKVTRNVEE